MSDIADDKALAQALEDAPFYLPAPLALAVGQYAAQRAAAAHQDRDGPEQLETLFDMIERDPPLPPLDQDAYFAAMRVIDRGRMDRYERRQQKLPIEHEDRRNGFDRRAAVAGRKD